MTSPPASTSWFSGLARASSMAGGVASSPASSAPFPDAPAAARSVVAAGAGAGGGKRKQLRGALFKYGPKSAQVRALTRPSRPPARGCDLGVRFWDSGELWSSRLYSAKVWGASWARLTAAFRHCFRRMLYELARRGPCGGNSVVWIVLEASRTPPSVATAIASWDLS